MGGQRFEDLGVWQRGKKLTVAIHKIFKECKDFAFRDQITRSALSVPSNIAEGYDRNSNKEFIRFLLIAKGSCGELRSQLAIASEIGFVDKEETVKLIKDAEEISYMLSSLAKKRKTF